MNQPSHIYITQSSITKKNIPTVKNTQIKKLKHLISRAFTMTSKMGLQDNQHFQHCCHLFCFVKYSGKWVINHSKRDLTPKEKSFLQKGLLFVVTQATIPIKEYISTTTLLLWQFSRQVNSMVLTAVASTRMSIEFLTPTPINQYIQTSPKHNI